MTFCFPTFVPRVAQAGPAPSFHPADLFGSGEDGVVWDFSALDTLFQERTGGGSTPTAVDGAIGTVRDLSGSNFHGTASSDGARPVLRQSGALYYAEFSGTGDHLGSNAFTLYGASATVALAGRITGDQGIFASDFVTGGGIGRWSEYDDGTAPMFLDMGGSATAYVDNTLHTTGQLGFWSLGTAANVTFRGTGVSPTESWMSGIRAPRFGSCRIHALVVIGRPLEAGETSSLEAWLRGKAGL
jgi:hypothetical protein